MISIVTFVALLAAAAEMRRPHSLSANGETAGMPASQELQHAAGAGKLSAEDFDDRSLVFPRETKR